MTDLQKFLNAVAEDNDLRSTLFKYARDYELEPNELANSIIKLGAKRGLTFTEDEVRDYFVSKKSSDVELSDIELDVVAGGAVNNKDNVQG